MQSELGAYLGVVALITVTPGADTAVVVRSAIAGGTRRGVATAAGSATGLLVWGAATALGIAALLAASAAAFTAVKLAGALYLIWLGVQAIRHAGRAEPGEAGGADATRAAAFRRGLLTNLLNPKAALFFTALLPQFLSPDDPALAASALMTAIAAGASLGGLSLYAYLVARAGDVLRRPHVRRRLDQCSGAVLILLGMRVAVERRA
jgi:threonine/homoserine/homoserine lactone efflux protein